MDLSLPDRLSEPLIILGTVTVAYTLYHYSDLLLRRMITHEDPAEHQIRVIQAQRAIGTLLLGVVPALIVVFGLGVDLTSFGLGAPDWTVTGLFLAFTIVVVLPIVWRSTCNPNTWSHYPQFRTRRWSRRTYLRNLVGWTSYLSAYEFFFRGFLLFGMTYWVGPWPAIAITTLAYVFAHLPKYAGETFGTIPMGVVFAWVTLKAGAIWPALLAHVLIANFSDWSTTRQDPSITRIG